MKAYTVVMTPRDTDRLSRALVPAGRARCLQTDDPIYQLFYINGRASTDEECGDLDGALLSVVRSFGAEAEARAWGAEDVAQRRALREAAPEGPPS